MWLSFWWEIWGGSRGGSGGSVEPPKPNVKTYNKRVVNKKWTNSAKPLQIAPENAGNCNSEALKLKIFRESMPPDPPRGYRLWRAFIRTPLCLTIHNIISQSWPYHFAECSVSKFDWYYTILVSHEKSLPPGPLPKISTIHSTPTPLPHLPQPPQSLHWPQQMLSWTLLTFELGLLKNFLR